MIVTNMPLHAEPEFSHGLAAVALAVGPAVVEGAPLIGLGPHPVAPWSRSTMASVAPWVVAAQSRSTMGSGSPVP